MLQTFLLAIAATELFDQRSRHVILNVTIEHLQQLANTLNPNQAELIIPNLTGVLTKGSINTASAFAHIGPEEAPTALLYPPGTTLESLNVEELTLANLTYHRLSGAKELLYSGEEVTLQENAVNFWQSTPITHAEMNHLLAPLLTR